MFHLNLERTRPYTLQSAFNCIWKFFVEEKHPQSFSELGNCQYRSSSSACAIGCLIPDGIIKPSQNDETIDVIIDLNKEVKRLLGGIPITTLKLLQKCHDCTRSENFSEVIQTKLETFAFSHDLTVPKEVAK